MEEHSSEFKAHLEKQNEPRWKIYAIPVERTPYANEKDDDSVTMMTQGRVVR